MSSADIESFGTVPMASPPPAYPYAQYSDDENLQAFFQVLNSIAQGYLNWYTDTPLSVYTNVSIFGLLLDWVGNNLYNVPRPAVSTVKIRRVGAMGSVPMGTLAMGAYRVIQSGTVQVADDDLYKRLITWCTWQGDGDQLQIPWLKKRIARFLYGANGSGVDVGMLSNISITPTMMMPIAGIGSRPIGYRAIGAMTMVAAKSVKLTISLANSPMSQTFAAFVASGIIPLPIQCTYKVILT